MHSLTLWTLLSCPKIVIVKLWPCCLSCFSLWTFLTKHIFRLLTKMCLFTYFVPEQTVGTVGFYVNGAVWSLKIPSLQWGAYINRDHITETWLYSIILYCEAVLLVCELKNNRFSGAEEQTSLLETLYKYSVLVLFTSFENRKQV